MLYINDFLDHSKSLKSLHAVRLAGVLVVVIEFTGRDLQLNIYNL